VITLKNPETIRCVVFDFDGTLVMSNAIKRDGFTAVAKAFPNGEAAMDTIMANPPGDRYAITQAFAALYNADATELVERYGQWCEDNILICPERTGATEVLKTLTDKGLPIWLNSATPEAPLQAVVAKRYPTGTFAGVLGGHACKVKNLRKVMQHENLTPAQILMVGDGYDDRDGAADFGCPFIGLTEGSLERSDAPGLMITDLTEITHWL